MADISIKELFEAGVHFGHRTQRWNPRMKPFIYEARNGIYLINLEKTHEQLKAACDFLRETARRGEKVLFVGCKKSAQDTVRTAAIGADCPYVVDRWLGGTLTNLTTIRRSVKRLETIEGMEKSGEMDKLPKQEAAKLKREKNKLIRNLQGIRNMEKIPAAMVIIDTTRETIAIAEARRLQIPVVAVVDTNADPSDATYPVAGNDDAIRSVKILVEAFAGAVAGAASGAVARKEKEAAAAV